jgi:nicotinamidase/pyrazinamidase
MDALILVDLQNDFMPGGALAVPEGNRVVPIANRLMERFELVVATADWHPANHSSFANNHPGRKIGEVLRVGNLDQILWPDHCIQKTFGAEFHPELDQTGIDHVVHKGTNPELDSYSGFFDNGHVQATGLEDYLRSQGVKRVVILGLATDYCVKFTALDALQLGFETILIQDGCRAVNLQPGDGQRALEELERQGAQVISSQDIDAIFDR